MKLRLMDFIVCPKCKRALALRVDQSETRRYDDSWREKILASWGKG